MSKTSCLAVHATIQGDGCEISYRPPQSPAQNASAPEGGPTSYALTIGQTAIPVPTGALRALLVPSLTSTSAKHFSTTSTDFGVAFMSDFQVVTVTGVATLYVTSAAAESISVLWL